MRYENVLLIGGPEDGRRLSVMEGLPSLKMLPRTEAAVRFSDQNREPTASTCGLLEYRRMAIRSHMGFSGAVYVFGDIDPMAALIEGYRRP